MANTLDSTGLTINTQAELIAIFQAGFESIYGSDINLDADSPDGQMMMIYIQALLDNLDLLVQVYNSFDPDTAIGVALDQRVAINGIQRQAGTFTITPVSITVTKALTLYGADQSAQDVYTVADNAGNEWELIATVSPTVAGTNVYNFQSVLSGARSTILNTITVPVTIVLGVSTINNPSTYITLGIDEESDADLRERRKRSVSIAAQGYLAALTAALENITGVSYVKVYENTDNSTDADGIPGHSIWAVISGSGAPVDIANAIYKKRNGGCGMRGDQSYAVTQPDTSLFLVKWDNVEAETLFIKATLSSLDGVVVPDIAAIRAGLPDSFTPSVYEQVNINDLATEIQLIDNNSLVTLEGFSTTSGGVYTDTLFPTAKNKQHSVTEANIILLPVQVSPLIPSVAISGNQTFVALGGFGAYVWTVTVDNSGGASIVSGTGVYTAGSGAGTDTIRATDSLGNYIETTVVVS